MSEKYQSSPEEQSWVAPTQAQAEKRFLLSTESFAQERMEAVKTTMDEFKKTHPGVLSFCMFGSMVKARAHEGSDIDGTLYFDPDHIPPPDAGEAASVENDVSEIADRYQHEFRSHLQHEGNLTDDQVKDIKAYPISGTIISNTLRAYKEYMEANYDYFDAEEAYERGEITEKPQPSTLEEPKLHTLSRMFHLAVDQGITPYRQYVVKELSTMGPKGEIIWHRITQKTEWLEQDFNTTNKHYPRTLSEAQQRYLPKEQA